METPKIQVVLPEGENELIIREGSAQNILELRAPVKLNLKGTIGSVLEFLSKRISEPDQVEQERCHILIDREKIQITLVLCEEDDYRRGTIVGILEQHPKFKEFGINSGRKWEPNELGQFFKMNRAFFPDRENNMKLVTQLKNFVANINSVIEREKSETGSFKDNFYGTVSSNVPGVFTLNLPIFKGIPAAMIEIEFYASVNGKEISLQLYSPGANQLLEDIRDSVIDSQIAQISAIAPKIIIIEQ